MREAVGVGRCLFPSKHIEHLSVLADHFPMLQPHGFHRRDSFARLHDHLVALRVEEGAESVHTIRLAEVVALRVGQCMHLKADSRQGKVYQITAFRFSGVMVILLDVQALA